MERYRPNITALENEYLGKTKVTLEGGKICRKRECIIGNLLTEAMVYNRVKAHINDSSTDSWTDSAIAFYNGGGIRSPIEFMGSIKAGNVLTGLPFQSRIIMVDVRGRTILNALEHSAEIYTNKAAGGFLQMYGARVTYNTNNKIGERVLDVKVLCQKCQIPKYETLEMNKIYTILITDFLYDGGDKYVFREKDNDNFVDLSVADSDVFIDFVRDRELIYPTLDGRIAFKSAGFVLRVNCFVIVMSCIWSYFQ